MTVRVFPVRHHGPGSARALAASLGSWEPDAVLIEGPPEANAVLGVAGSAEMRPPVALLAYLPGQARAQRLLPAVSWSPEWVALRHAAGPRRPGHDDRPASRRAAATQDGGPPTGPAARMGSQRCRWRDRDRWATGLSDDDAGDPIAGWPRRPATTTRNDGGKTWSSTGSGRNPGTPSPKRWPSCALDPGPGLDGAHLELEAQREASMRQHIRAAEKQHDRVAVVCGAWHAPVLVERGPAKPDQALLAGLPRERATVTWVPWTYTRLAFASGYGAGVTSPGWYEHLYTSPDRPIERWMVKVAALLRAEQLDASPASVVEAVRLAEALATMRSRPLAGLAECTDAARSVLGGGYDTVLDLIGRRLVVGDAIGEVPPGAPTVPLAADLAAQQRRLRLRPESGARRSRARPSKGHRPGPQPVAPPAETSGRPLGEGRRHQRGTGTFREEWALHWEPELSVRAIEASLYGTDGRGRGHGEGGRARRQRRARRRGDQAGGAVPAGRTPGRAPGGDGRPRRAFGSQHRCRRAHGRCPAAGAGAALRDGTPHRGDRLGTRRPWLGGAAMRQPGTCRGLPRRRGRNCDDRADLGRHGGPGTARRPVVATGMARRPSTVLSAVPSLHGLPAGRATRIVFDAELITAEESPAACRPLFLGERAPPTVPPGSRGSWQAVGSCSCTTGAARS